MSPEKVATQRAEVPQGDSPALAPVHDALRQSFTEKALDEIKPIFREIQSARNTNDHITISRAQPILVPLKCDFVNGNIRATSIEMGNVEFDLDRTTRTASNIQGIKINLAVFGTNHDLSVQKLRLGQDQTGENVLHMEVENPLPEPAERIIGMPPTLTIQVPITRDGIANPRLSRVFSEAASSTNSSIAGLLAADALKEASKVALFVESNPEWINSVVQPALQEIYKALATPPAVPKPADVPPPPKPGNPANPGGNPGNPTDKSPAAAAPEAVKLPPELKEPGDHKCKLSILGVEREFTVHVPPSYNGKTPMPLVVVLHGHAQDGREIARHTKMNELADKKGFIAIYPDARVWAGREEWRAWDTDNGLIPIGSKADDVSFLRQIIQKTENELVVDPKRIYMAGLSNGGMMTYRAAGDLSDKLAAIAVVSGAMGGQEPPPKQPISVLNIHGTRDEIVPYNGLRNVPASLTSIGLPKFKPMTYATDFWKDQNKITNPPIVLQNGDITQRRFINSETGAEVNEYTIAGGHHVPDQIEALTETIWQFFESHPKSGGQSSGTAQPAPEEPFNITERIKAHARTRGVHGLEIDFGKMLAEVPYVKNGSFSPSGSFKEFESRSGIKLDDDISRFLKSTTDVSKNGTRIQLNFEAPRQIQIDQGSGPVSLHHLNIQNTSFNLRTVNGLPIVSDISGISLRAKALGQEMDVPVRYAEQKMDSNAVPYYLIKTDNPLPRWARIAMIADSQIPVQLRLNDDARPLLLNERQIKDATLGYNPVTRGWLDTGTHVYNFYQSPSVTGGLHVAKDLVIYGGTGWGAYKLAAMRYGMKGRVGAVIGAGTLLAPSIIHGIERLID